MMSFSKLTLAGFLILVALNAVPFIPTSMAAPFPRLEFPKGFAIACHGLDTKEKLEAAFAAGFRVIRCGLLWHRIEKTLGVYDWSRVDGMAERYAKAGLKPIFVLDYSNPLYEPDKAAPRRDRSINAFVRWAAAATRRYRGRGIIWEIWNEPNLAGFWKPKPDRGAYTKLALATCRAIKNAAPGEVIIGPAAFGFPWKFLETLFRSGILECLDGVSVHPYRHSPPGTAVEEFAILRGLIDKYAPDDRTQVPIVVTEWGYHTTAKTGVSVEIQASHFISTQLISQLHGIPIVVWHRWNDFDKPDYWEANFGLVGANGKPKPSLLAAKRIATVLAGFRIICRLAKGTSNDFFLLLSNNQGARKVLAWTLREAHIVTLTLPAVGKKPRPEKWPPTCDLEKGSDRLSFWISRRLWMHTLNP